MTALDLNIGYYTISISPARKEMTTIVTEFGKFIYNCLPMGMCALGDIFKAKVDELLRDIEGVKRYIDGILILSKDSFEKHIEYLRIIFGILHAVRLKVNAHKCSFGLKVIPYLVFVLTGEGIKSDPKKVKVIMNIGRPATTTEARALIGMVQYYRDMWPRRSYILAPLKEAASGPKGRKYYGMTYYNVSLKK